LGTKHYSSQMSEVADVTDLLLGFERHNNIRLEVRMSLINQEKNASIAMSVLAHSVSEEIGDQPPLASANVICSDINLRRLMDVLTHVLYSLDFQLACNELPEVETKR